MMNTSDNAANGMGMGFGGISMLLFWGLIIFVIVAIIMWLANNRHGNNPSKQKTALEVLEERYARGEINEQEYQKKRHDLES